MIHIIIYSTYIDTQLKIRLDIFRFEDYLNGYTGLILNVLELLCLMNICKSPGKFVCLELSNTYNSVYLLFNNY